MRKLRHSKLAWVAALVVLVSWTRAAHADVVRLQVLEAQALRGRPMLAANDAHIAQARARIDQARSAYAPAISLIGDASIAPGHSLVKVLDDNKQPVFVAGSLPLDYSGAFTPLPRYGATIDVRGNLYDFGRTGAAVDAAGAQQRAAQADARKAAQDVVRDVRAAYVRWATADALCAIARQSAQAAEQRNQSTAASIEEGARRSADRIGAQTEAAFAKLELERAEATLETARIDLGFVCVADLAPDAQPDPAVLSAAPSTQTARESLDPSFSALEAQRTAAQATARSHDRAFVPVLGAQAQVGMQGAGEHLFPVYRVGISLSVPLWDGGAESSVREQAQARAAELAAQQAEYTHQRKHARALNHAAIAQAQRRMELADTLVTLTETRSSQLEEAYPLGAASLQELADARAAVQRAKTERVLAQAMRAEARLGVE